MIRPLALFLLFHSFRAVALDLPCLFKLIDKTDFDRGLMAAQFIEKGTVIFTFEDAIPGTKTYLSVQVEAGLHVETEELGRLNHSCSPNVIIDAERREVRATRNIQADELLTFFYPSSEWDMEQPFDCRCSPSESCLGSIQGTRYFTRATFQGFFVNPHILELIAERDTGS